MTADIATVTAKGQVTIPKAIRDAMGIAEKDRLLFLIEDDRVILVPLPRRPLTDLYGALPATRPFPGMQAIREQVRKDLGERISRGEE